MVNKKLLITMALALSLGLSGCSKNEVKQEEPVKQEETTSKTEETVEPEVDEQDEEKPEEKEPEKKEPEKSKVSVNIYKLDENGEKFITETVEYDELNEQNIWTSLQEAEVVAKKAKLLLLTQTNDKLEMDVNEEFGNQLRSSGTFGEEALLHCVVNTYLDAYKCEEIRITEEKGTLISGHAEYDRDMVKFE